MTTHTLTLVRLSHLPKTLLREPALSVLIYLFSTKSREPLKRTPILHHWRCSYERVEISKEFVSRKEKNTKMFSLKVVGDPVFRVFEYLIRFAFLGIINAKFYTKNFYLAPL